MASRPIEDRCRGPFQGSFQDLSHASPWVAAQAVETHPRTHGQATRAKAGQALRYAAAHTIEHNGAFWKGIAAGFLAGFSVAAALRFSPVEKLLTGLSSATEKAAETPSGNAEGRVAAPSGTPSTGVAARAAAGASDWQPEGSFFNLPSETPLRVGPRAALSPLQAHGFYSFRPAPPAVRASGAQPQVARAPDAANVPAWIGGASARLDPQPSPRGPGHREAEVVEIPGRATANGEFNAFELGEGRVDHIDLSKPYRRYPRYFDMGSAG